MKKFISGYVLILSLILAGCSSLPIIEMNYKPEYVVGDTAIAKIVGDAYLVIDKDNQSVKFHGYPNSFSGSAGQISVPLGELSREIGLKVLNTAFDGGVMLLVESKKGRYNIKTELRNFSYRYESLSNFGFRFTPIVSIELHAVVTDANGNILFEKNYTKFDFRGDTKYMVNVNMTIHKAVAECYKELAKDTADAINKNS